MKNKSNWQKLQTGELEWEPFRIRSRILKSIRTFFEEKGFLEIEPPYLLPCPTLDNNITSVQASILDEANNQYTFFLHTSPEHSMKKLLAAGAEKIFYLGKVFRNSETGPLHNPEFTMAEWYRTDADYYDIMNDTEELICSIADALFSKRHFIYGDTTLNLTPPWKKETLRKLFLDEIGIDINQENTKKSLQKIAHRHHIYFDPEDTRETLFFRIFLEKIEPNLGKSKPIWIMDYPIQMGLMAKPKPENPLFAERAELYIGGLELANGYSELLDAADQQKKFEHGLKLKISEGLKSNHIDYELISALEADIHPTAGIALGVDRLVMFFLNKKRIQDVILFPFPDLINQIIQKNKI